jgi:hypothetical protein
VLVGLITLQETPYRITFKEMENTESSEISFANERRKIKQTSLQNNELIWFYN